VLKKGKLLGRSMAVDHCGERDTTENNCFTPDRKKPKENDLFSDRGAMLKKKFGDKGEEKDASYLSKIATRHRRGGKT